MPFVESRLMFSFPSDWVVIKFDEHKFFRMLSGEGLKGVDFIGITDQQELLLMEVKNYRNINPSDGINPSRQLLDFPQYPIEEYLDKFADSLKLIRIVHLYYSRRWWYRNMIPYINSLFPFWSLKSNFGFWRKAFFQPPTKVNYCLYLQLEAQKNDSAILKFHQLISNEFSKRFPEFTPIKYTIVIALPPSR